MDYNLGQVKTRPGSGGTLAGSLDSRPELARRCPLDNSTPTPDPSVNLDPDLTDLVVAVENWQRHRRAAHLILIVLNEEIWKDGPPHQKSVAEIADDYGWCRSEVLAAAHYLHERSVIRLWVDEDYEEKEGDCRCASCAARRVWVAYWMDPKPDREEAARRRREEEARENRQRFFADRSTEGHVYLLRAGPRYKIGVAADLARRVKQLNAGQSPYEIELIHSVWGVGYQEFEKQLHVERWFDKVRGEWFEFGADDVAAIIECMNEWQAARPVAEGGG